VTRGPARPRDFLETGDGLFFAVVSPLLDEGRYLTSLRYVREQGRLQKLDTASAAALLLGRHPDWAVHAAPVDASVHAVPCEAVVRVHQPEERFAALMSSGELDPVERAAVSAARVLVSHGAPERALGVSGSVLIGAQGPTSDVDLVAYGRDAFTAARQALGRAVAASDLDAPDKLAWHQAWDRRGSALTLDEYVWHERRKGTKAVLHGSRIDLSLVAHQSEQPPLPRGVRKLHRARLVARVTDIAAAFDHPARYLVAGDEVSEVMSFTPTYAGQALAGEMIEAAGWLEEDATGVRRLVVGSSREAPGEFIRVTAPDSS
jgi:hypothetical protein